MFCDLHNLIYLSKSVIIYMSHNIYKGDALFMPERVLTIISTSSEQDHFDCNGNFLFTARNPKPSHLDFYMEDQRLRLENAVIKSLSFEGNVLSFEEHYRSGNFYVTRHHLHSSETLLLKNFLKETNGGN